ncbi:MAG: hypothetical protein WC506_00245 [Candidatus Micrarchaeia archaeon]
MQKSIAGWNAADCRGNGGTALKGGSKPGLFWDKIVLKLEERNLKSMVPGLQAYEINHLYAGLESNSICKASALVQLNYLLSHVPIEIKEGKPARLKYFFELKYYLTTINYAKAGLRAVEDTNRSLHLFPKSQRFQFIENIVLGVLSHFLYRGDDAEGKMSQAIAIVRGHMLSKDPFLHPSVMESLTIRPRDSDTCGQTKEFFKKAAKTRMLLKTTAPIGGTEETVYVKGVGSSTGQPLFYHIPSNAVYAFENKGCRIVGSARRHEFSHADLREGLSAYESANAGLPG